MIEGCLSLGATHPISLWAKTNIFLAVIHLFDIAYLSKWLFHSETPFKMINYGPRVQRLRNTSGTFYKRQDRCIHILNITVYEIWRKHPR